MKVLSINIVHLNNLCWYDVRDVYNPLLCKDNGLIFTLYELKIVYIRHLIKL